MGKQVMKNIGLILLITLLLSSCDSLTYNENFEIVPYYSECEGYIGDYKKVIFNEYKINIDVSYFKDKNTYRAHPSIKGIVKLSGYKNDNDLSVVINGLELLCYPKHYVITKLDNLGLRMILELMERNKFSGKNNSFIELSKDEISIYYNNTNQNIKNSIVK